MKSLYIIGARGYGRVIYNLFLNCKPYLKEIECVGFLDDKKDALDGFEGYPPIISSVEAYQPQENDVFICALGDPKFVKHYSDIIKSKGGDFISLIAPTVKIDTNTRIGKGCIIHDWTGISCDVTIGNHVSIGMFCDIGHDVTIGDYSHIGSFGCISGGVNINAEVLCHPRVNVIPHKTIGARSIIGVGSVVIKNISADSSVFGVPAKKII